MLLPLDENWSKIESRHPPLSALATSVPALKSGTWNSGLLNTADSTNWIKIAMVIHGKHHTVGKPHIENTSKPSSKR